jgi:hypothetical protein
MYIYLTEMCLTFVCNINLEIKVHYTKQKLKLVCVANKYAHMHVGIT